MDYKYDTLYINGTVYQVNEHFDTAQAIGITDGEISFIGSNEQAEAIRAEANSIIDLEEAFVFPGFIESHAHLLNIGRAQMELELSAAETWEEIVSMVKKEVEQKKAGEWIIGRGWHHEKWSTEPSHSIGGFPTHHLLTLISKENPVYLTHANGHMAIVNAAALELAGVDGETKVDTDSEIIYDASAQPTGVLIEHAMDLVLKVMKSSYDSNEAFDLAVTECLSKGITSFYDMGSTESMITLYRYKYGSDPIPLRLSVTRLIQKESEIEAVLSHEPETALFKDTLDIRGVKILSDGALGSRGAWLLEAYTDRPGHYGNCTFPMDKIGEVAALCLQKGFQLIVHAIGDRANREVLDQMSTAIIDHPLEALDHRFRIEHAQHLHPDDIPRFHQFNIIPSVQTIHMSSDRSWAIDRLGEQRIKEGAYMWASLIDSGATLINGTDAPIEPVDPLPCIYAAVSRKALDGTPENGYEAEQKMSREQAIRSYTIHGAYGMFSEEKRGSLELGKYADMVILDTDLMNCVEEDILSASVIKTILAGREVYSKS